MGRMVRKYPHSLINRLPDNGNAKTFRNFVKNEEQNVLFTQILESPIILNFYNKMDKSLLEFSHDEYHIYFTYLEYMMKTKDPSYYKHMRWIGETLNYEELLEIENIYPKIEVSLFSLNFTNKEGEELIFNFGI